MNNQNQNKNCRHCGQPYFTAGEMEWIRDVCLGRGGCCPRMTCCQDEQCKNYQYFRVYMMTSRRTKIINVKQESKA